MRYWLAVVAVAAIAVSAAAVAQPQQKKEKLYRWVDEKGIVHYGDSVPPQYANRDRAILNEQGVRVGFEQGDLSDEQRAALEKAKEEDERKRAEKAEVARRDRMLLQTYLSVGDIEDLRNRRLELLESQIKVTELYLNNLRKRLVGLQEEASAYKPYTAQENAPQIPQNLALDISRTASSINVYEQTLSRTRSDQETLRKSFDDDIRRFKELKGG